MKKLFFLPLLTSAQIFAQSPGNLSYLSSTTGAACYEIEYFNNHVYAGAGNTLMVYDLNANRTPNTKIFETRLRSNISDIKFRNGKMYIAANHAGLSVWNINNGIPQLITEMLPSALDEAAYDIAFKGPDSVFISYKSKMALFKFDSNLNTLTLLTTFAQQVNGTYVMGCDVKNNLLAFCTSAFDSTASANARTGVHLVNANNFSNQYYFFEQDTCDPQDVIFGQNTNLLHVLGGTESWVNGANSYGIYYALNVANPSAPVRVFRDSLPNNFYFNIAQPMNGELRNDTLYIATEGAWDRNNSLPDHGYIYVYNCNNNSVQFINELNAGLWHFDLALNGNRLYVASEWYGIKTLNISNPMSEIDMGNTLTGGWNLSADKHGDRLALANEGYGFKLFDISDPYNPTYLKSKNDTGFCQGLSFSSDGSHLFGWYYTDDDFRVFDTSGTMTLVSSMALTTLADYFDPAVYQDYAMAEQRIGLNHYLVAIDVSVYNNPVIVTNFLMGGILYRDMCVSRNGFLYTATTGTIKVYNINNGFQQVTSVNAPFGQTFSCIAEYKDTLYAYVDNGSPGIRKYFFNGSNLTLISGNIPISPLKPKYLAVDSFGLYADYQQEGLYAFTKNAALTQAGYYRHSMEFYRPNNWGQQQLFCKDNLVFDVEYLGQTSILSFDPQLVSTNDPVKESELKPFPVPVERGTTLTIPNNKRLKNFFVYDEKGALQKVNWIMCGNDLIIDTSVLPAGIYIFSVYLDNEDHYRGKFIVR